MIPICQCGRRLSTWCCGDFASLRGLCQIRRCVPPATLVMMVVALVHSRLDYGNGVLVGLPAYLMRQLQSVLSAAARLIFRLKSSNHITDALISLHWLWFKSGSVQARCHGIQSATWKCTKLPRATCLRRRCAWSSSTPLRWHESHPGAASHVLYRRQSSLPGRCPTNLEFSTQ